MVGRVLAVSAESVGEHVGEQQGGEVVEGDAQDVALLGLVGGGSQVLCGVHDRADRAPAGREELGGSGEYAELVDHLPLLLGCGLAVLGVEHPHRLRGVVGEDRVEVDAALWWAPAGGHEGEAVRVRGAEARRGRDRGALPGGAGGCGMNAVGRVLAREVVAVQGGCGEALVLLLDRGGDASWQLVLEVREAFSSRARMVLGASFSLGARRRGGLRVRSSSSSFTAGSA